MDRPTRDPNNSQPDDGEPVQIRPAQSQLPRAVVTIKLDVYDVIFISLILAAGAWSHVHFMP